MYDLIGDIHGHADELILLLEQLGYDRRRGYYSHPRCQAIFVGDFIDRGPQIRQALEIVRPMVDNKAARAVMGNHEFNALCYHTRLDDGSGEFLRPHTAKNVHQHQQTVLQVPPAELFDYLEWFRTLPLNLELDEGIRIVHACWDADFIKLINSYSRENGRLTDEFLHAASTRGHELCEAVEVVLKGPELQLPKGLSYADKDGHERQHMRTRWFESPRRQTYRSFALTAADGLPDYPLPESLSGEDYKPDDPPVFFGHYWLKADKPSILAPKVACLDYSVAKGGMLVAYRWNGERELSNENFVTVKSR